MTNSRHAPPPAVCPSCLDAFFESLKDADERIAFLHCAHRGGTLVRVHVSGGAIKTWRLSAPRTLEEAQLEIAASERTLERLGMIAPTTPGSGGTH